MSKSNEIILPIIVAIILAAIPFWFFVNYSEKYVHYHRLANNGLEAIATLLSKGIKVNEHKLIKLFQTNSSQNYQFLVAFKTADNKLIKCQFGVSKNTYDAVSNRDQLSIIYLPSNPGECTLPSSARLIRYLLLAVLIVSFIFVLIAIGFSYYIYKSFKKREPGEEVRLTSNMDLAQSDVSCPRCGAHMTEGYLPTVGGVSWRDKDEPVGIPTILSGLPGTTFWIKRPKLHAFHCKSCKIITFKYGKD